VQSCANAFYLNKYVNDVVNIGNDNELSILELAKKIIEITNSKSKIIHLPSLEEGDMTRRCPDITKMMDLLQRELTPLDEGIKKLLSAWKVKIN
jgi:UDP-glucose 4-epimerase